MNSSTRWSALATTLLLVFGLGLTAACSPPEDDPPPSIVIIDGGADTGPQGCATGTECAGACVDTNANPNHCGGCGMSCGDGEICSAGQCKPQVTDCSKEPCPSGYYCDLNTTQCKPGCGSDADCTNGTCEIATHTCTCSSGFHDCAGSCVTNNDVAHCGDRCMPCPTPGHATATCNGSSCGFRCDSGYRNCGGSCVKCPETASTTTCDGNQCIASSCPDGMRSCNGTCKDCPSQGVAQTTCKAGQCQASDCQSGFELCGGTCTQCPTQNVTDTACAGSSCRATDCKAGYMVCSSGCCPIGQPGSPLTLTGYDGAVDVSFDSGANPTVSHISQAGSDSSTYAAVSVLKGPGNWSTSAAGTASGGQYYVGDEHKAAPHAYRGNTVWVVSGSRDYGEMYPTPHVWSVSNGQWTERQETPYEVGQEPLELIAAANSQALIFCKDGLRNPRCYQQASPGKAWDGFDLDYRFRGSADFIELTQAPSGTYYALTYDDFDQEFALQELVNPSAGDWKSDVIAKPSCFSRQYTLSFDASGSPHVLFYDCQSKEVRHATKQSGGWQISTVGTSESNAVGDVVVNSSGQVYGCFGQGRANQNDRLMVGWQAGGSWHTSAVPQSSTSGEIKDCWMTLGSNGLPKVLYLSEPDNIDAKLRFVP